MKRESSFWRRTVRFRSVVGNEHFMAGSFFVLVGSLALWLSLDYPTGSATRMQAGYFPRLISGLLILIGLVIASGVMSRHTHIQEDAPLHEWRPTLFVPLAMMAFGGTIDTLGLIPAIFVAIIVLACAEKKRRWGQALIMGTGLSVFAYVVFIQALGLPMPIFPRF